MPQKTTTAAQILGQIGPSCRDDTRRSLLEGRAGVNGIDFVEYELVAGVHTLHVHFLNDVAGLAAALADADVYRIHGGTRIVGFEITPSDVAVADPKVVDLQVDQQGDYAPYLLSIGWSLDTDGYWTFDLDGLDRHFSVAPVNFRPGCLIDFDCKPGCDCHDDVLEEPVLDYLAKDYASFRQLLLDLVAERNPSWTERSPADVGIALLELFAYEGDYLSYLQDAVANEAYLDTARQRISAKRHAKLIDYAMHDGRNAWTYAQFTVADQGAISPGVQLVTKIAAPLKHAVPPLPPSAVLPNAPTDIDYLTDPALANVRVFETSAVTQVHYLNNELRIHAWGDENCCLPAGATTAHLYGLQSVAENNLRAALPPLAEGDLLLLEEVAGPATGARADADPTHRQVVRIAYPPVDLTDELFIKDLKPDGTPYSVAERAGAALHVLEVTWAKVDALTFPLCVSATLADGETTVPAVSVARGNVAPADHGRTVRETFDFAPATDGDPLVRLPLSQGPQTIQAPFPPDAVWHFADAAPPARTQLSADVHEAVPAVTMSTTPDELWLPTPDFFGPGEPAPRCVVDVDDTGRAVLRFGDGQYGSRFVGITQARVAYRIGVGRPGNIGAEGLAHVVTPAPLPVGWPTIQAVRNPLPARDGIDPETIEEVRRHAPAAVRAVQYRAVTEDDYRRAALTLDGVASAVASFRWTGSWYTVFVGIDPVDTGNAIVDARGLVHLDEGFRLQVLDGLTRYRLAGYDLEIRAARYVPLDVELQLCVTYGYFAGDVSHAAALALQRLFDPAGLSFGQPVYLSRLYATVEGIDGVELATVTAFHRWGRDPGGELEAGVMSIGPWEIARLDNDPSNIEMGALTITAGGGS